MEVAYKSLLIKLLFKILFLASFVQESEVPAKSKIPLPPKHIST